MQITSVFSPVWANVEQTLINCNVTIDEFGDEVLPFTAGAHDVEPHGQKLFQDLMAGVYGAVGAYVEPPYEPPPAPISITALEFIDRFTESEQLAIVTATMSNAQVKLWYDKLLAASSVVFADPRVSAGLDGLVAAGLISAERKAEILPEATSSGVTPL